MGILYIATGRQCREEAVHSAHSIREHLGDQIPIAIFSDQKIADESFDLVSLISTPSFDYADKINFLKFTPFQKTLFLDCDTHICADFSELFPLLDKFDFAAAHEPGRISLKNGQRVNLDGIQNSFSEFNTGVILYNNTKPVTDIFDCWSKQYAENKELCEHDQPTFSKAIYDSQCKFYVLPPEYNVKFHTCCFLSGKAKILHSRIEDAKIPGIDKEKAWKILEKCINENQGCRCLFPEFGIIMGTGEFGFELQDIIHVKKTCFKERDQS